MALKPKSKREALGDPVSDAIWQEVEPLVGQVGYQIAKICTGNSRGTKKLPTSGGQIDTSKIEFERLPRLFLLSEALRAAAMVNDHGQFMQLAKSIEARLKGLKPTDEGAEFAEHWSKLKKANKAAQKAVTAKGQTA